MGKNMNLVTAMGALCWLLIAANTTVAAETKDTNSPWVKTEVIEDRGGYPIDSYLPGHNKSDAKAKANFEKRRSTKLVNAHFPVITKSMSVGKVGADEAMDIKYQVAMRPMFIVGYDPVSISWLKTNKDLLAEKKAIGLVVNVESKEQMDALQKIVGDEVMMQPTPGDRLSEHLKIKHYPFYMDNQGVMR